MSRHAVVRATGCYVPEHELSNAALQSALEQNGGLPKDAEVRFIDKMEPRTAITTRWLAKPGAAASDVALPAARHALERAGLVASDLDLVVVGTDSPDHLTPATSVVLQHKLGARGAGTFDVGCACASFPTALSIVAGLIGANPALRRALVVGVYRMSALAAADDPMRFFYGDGAGAAVVEAADAPGVLTSAFAADGSFAPRWGIFAGGTAEPPNAAALEAGRMQVRMVEGYPPEVNDRGWPQLVRTLAAQGEFSVEAIDLAIFTQVRRPTIETVMRDLGLPMSKTHTVMEKWGYTGSACVPMALHDAVEQGKVSDGDLVVLVGSGVGYNQAGVALRWAA
ncbi:MAG: 3-oxoacyl-ACP synthase [Proteobacteria bacterium]|nr:MAG: 3-oxoacyl-ACP synthase [Pseudomonadota bacterium]